MLVKHCGYFDNGTGWFRVLVRFLWAVTCCLDDLMVVESCGSLRNFLGWKWVHVDGLMEAVGGFGML